MEEKKQHFWHIMVYYFKKGKNTIKMKKKKDFCAIYGEGAVTDLMCQKWFAKFHAGDFLREDAPSLGRPVEVDSERIETLIENNQFYTTWEIANILKISKSSVANYLHQLGYVNRFNVWVLHKLSKKTFLTVFPHEILYLNVMKTFLFFFFKLIFIFIFGCVGSLFLCEGFLQLRQAGATLHRGAQASHYHGLSCCGAQAPDAQAQ